MIGYFVMMFMSFDPSGCDGSRLPFGSLAYLLGNADFTCFISFAVAAALTNLASRRVYRT
jgi:hypothetical protein